MGLANRAALASAFGVALSAVSPTAASGAQIAVTTGADVRANDGSCSLREAIIAANANAASGGAAGECPAGDAVDSISLPAGAYTLSIFPGAGADAAHGDLDALADLTIQGAGSGSASIDAAGIDRVLEVGPGAIVTLEGLTLKGGRSAAGSPGARGSDGSVGAPGGEPPNNTGGAGGTTFAPDGTPGAPGGGILNRGNLTLTGSVVTGNAAGPGGRGGDGGTGGAGGPGAFGGAGGPGGWSWGGDGGSGGFGGGIANLATLTVTNSRISGNSSGAGGAGGNAGAAGAGGAGSTTVNGAIGGAGGWSIGGFGGAGGDGGGIYSNGTLSITGSLVNSNAAGAGGAAGNGAAAGPGGNGGPAGSVGGTGGSGGGSQGVIGGDGGSGGGIFSTVTTGTATATTIASNISGAGGHGGAGGAGGRGGNGGTQSAVGGPGGDGGVSLGGRGGFGGDGGGAVNVDLTNSTVTSNTTGAGGSGASGGSGGDGGTGSNTGAPNNPGGAGGDGGSSTGGEGVDGGRAGGLWDAAMAHATVSSNATGAGGAGGAGGSGGAGGAGGAGGSGGAAGTPGSTGSSTAGIPGSRPATGGLAGSSLIENTILASNLPQNCAAPTSNIGINIDFPDSPCEGLNADPKLGPLLENGGPSPTRALGPGSSATDAVPSDGSECAATDQRGVLRPQGPACDSGAYEVLGGPSATTGSADSVTDLAARLTGRTTPNAAASFTFEYGTTTAYGSQTTSQIPGAFSEVQVAAHVSGLSPETTYHFRLRVSTIHGEAVGADQTFTTAAAPAPLDRVAPALSRLGISPARFRAARSGPSIAVRTGTRVSYRLSEQATTSFRIERAARGVRRGRRCLKPRRGLRGRRCTRYVRLRGSFRHAGQAGQNSFRFSGRLRGRMLPARRYRLAATPRDAAGNGGKVVRTKFRIVR